MSRESGKVIFGKKSVFGKHVTKSDFIKRSTSAPPKDVEYEEEEELTPTSDFRSDPNYIEFYSKNKNLNPRLPPPLKKGWVSWNPELVREGFKKESSDEIYGDGVSSGLKVLPKSVGNKKRLLDKKGKKSVLSRIQMDFPRTPSPVYQRGNDEENSDEDEIVQIEENDEEESEESEHDFEDDQDLVDEVVKRVVQKHKSESLSSSPSSSINQSLDQPLPHHVNVNVQYDDRQDDVPKSNPLSFPSEKIPHQVFTDGRDFHFDNNNFQQQQQSFPQQQQGYGNQYQHPKEEMYNPRSFSTASDNSSYFNRQTNSMVKTTVYSGPFNNNRRGVDQNQFSNYSNFQTTNYISSSPPYHLQNNNNNNNINNFRSQESSLIYGGGRSAPSSYGFRREDNNTMEMNMNQSNNINGPQGMPLNNGYNYMRNTSNGFQNNNEMNPSRSSYPYGGMGDRGGLGSRGRGRGFQRVPVDYFIKDRRNSSGGEYYKGNFNNEQRNNHLSQMQHQFPPPSSISSSLPSSSSFSSSPSFSPHRYGMNGGYSDNRNAMRRDLKSKNNLMNMNHPSSRERTRSHGGYVNRFHPLSAPGSRGVGNDIRKDKNEMNSGMPRQRMNSNSSSGSITKNVVRKNFVNLSVGAQKLLEQIRIENKIREYTLTLSDIVEYVVELSKDQVGSRFIQKQLEEISMYNGLGMKGRKGRFGNGGFSQQNSSGVPLDQNPSVIDEVFENILPYSIDLMKDVFGNYVIQKFFEFGNENQIHLLCQNFKGHVLELTLQTYGCRVIQKALDVISDEEDKFIISDELENSVLHCVNDQNGNHVIQKCVEKLSPEYVGFILNEFKGNVREQAMHAYGCRVIQRILEFCTETQKRPVLREICAHVEILVRDQYGNYVVQHVLKHRNNHVVGRRGIVKEEYGEDVDMTHSIIQEIALNVVEFSFNKFASNVIEKCFEYGKESEKAIVIQQIVDEEKETQIVFEMMKHQYANYVIQKMIELSDQPNRRKLIDIMIPYIPHLKGTPYGKHILSCLNRYGDRTLEM